MRKHPEILYKFRAFDGRSISMLANSQLYFASPTEFNDPFDCQAQEGIFDGLDEEGALLLAKTFYGIENNETTSEQTERYLQMVNSHPVIKSECENQKKAFEQHINSFGVLCFSESYESILMWSHYADMHKGFCIGFKNGMGLGDGYIAKVNYSSERDNNIAKLIVLMKSLGSDDERLEMLTNKYILKKSEDWQYEKEWRILMRRKGLVTYEDKHIEQIIFGAKMLKEHKKTIVNLMASKGIKFYDAVKSKSKFSIELQSYKPD